MPVTNWTQSQVERLLTNSPWAVRTDATMDDPAEVDQRGATPIPNVTPSGVPGRNYAGGNDQRWDGSIGKKRRGSLATIPVMVRWDSANVVQQALLRQDKEGISTTSQPPDHFIITVIGLLPANQQKGAPTIKGVSSSEGGATASTEETLEWFMTHSTLAVKNAIALRPQNVKIDSVTGTVHLFFARSGALLEHKRDARFVTRYGTMNIQTRFRTKEMLTDGQPDL